jgi:hypothetical protein
VDRRTWVFISVGVVVTLLVAATAGWIASSDPDGLERVAVDEGFADTAEDSAAADSPLADYSVEGVEDDRVSTGLAGIIGVVATLLVTVGLLTGMRALHRRRAG